MAKAEYPILFDCGIVRMKGQCLWFLLVVKNDLDLAFLGRKPVLELLRYGEQAFLKAAGRRADREALLLGTHIRMTITSQQIR